MGGAKALVKTAQGPGSIELRDVSVREPGPGEAKLAVAAAGVCGTDLHIQDGEWPVNPPVIMGHEVSGTVTQAGPGVNPNWVGQRVTSEVWFSSDETCDQCIDGHRNLCPQRRSIGSHVDGAFAAELVVPARNLHRLSASLSLQEGALIEPLACVVGALCDPPMINAGDRILVAGPGPIGLLAAQVAAAHGAHVLVAGTARDADRLALATELGIAVASDVEPAGSITESFDAVLECSGSSGGANLCLNAAKRRGRYIQLGIFGSPVTTTLDALCLKQLTITSGFGASSGAIRRSLRLAEQGQVNLTPLISQVAPLKDWQQTFAECRAGSGMKYLLDPQQ